MKLSMTSLCTSSLQLGLAALLIAFSSGGSGCVIDEGGDDAGDDGTGGDGADDGSPADDGGDDGAPADDGADETAGEDGGAPGRPAEGAWVYEETGGTTNECTFFEASNGFGTYVIAADGPGAFTITPGDDTEPFHCTHDGATFECAERLQETVDAGGTSLQVLVSASGDLLSPTAMEGTQDGRVVCEGDCATAEQLLGTAFPCEFSIPWEGTKM